MPKYCQDKVFGHYLYFTSHCIIEAMHAHASDEELSEDGSAKLFVKADGSTVVQRRGRLTDRELTGIQAYIKLNYLEMYELWSTMSRNGFFVGKKGE